VTNRGKGRGKLLNFNLPDHESILRVMIASESRISNVGSTNNSIDNSLDTQTGDTKKKKETQPRSGIWDHFDKLVENGIGRAKCKYCKHSYAANSSKNGTTFGKVQ
ncbi:hypothetical protein HAX54_036838, partial [Datura stramonium]|nr:hypothetical protein [Datura stramonium]